MAAPLMVPIVIGVWIILVLAGYACVYYVGMNGETFYFENPVLGPTFGEALYVSGTAISTLGFGDVAPTSGVYQALAVSEGLIGFGISTLSVTYVVGIHGVLQHLGILAAGLLHQASDTAEPSSILKLHFPDGEPRDLDHHVMTFHRGFVEVYEGLRRYPVVYYYHSRRPYRSLPYTFHLIGGVTAALRWGLPKDHPGCQTPWLPTLIIGFDMVTTFLNERFLSGRLEEAPSPVPFETFRATSSTVRNPRTRGWSASSRCAALYARPRPPRGAHQTRRRATIATRIGSPSPSAARPSLRRRREISATSCTNWTVTPTNACFREPLTGQP